MKTNKSLKERRQITEEYILNCISSSGYNVELKTNKDKLNFVYDNFKSEQDFNIKRIGEFKSFVEHIGGLPSYLNIDYQYYKILEFAEKLGYLNLSDSEEDKFINGFYTKITTTFFKMLERENKKGVVKNDK